MIKKKEKNNKRNNLLKSLKKKEFIFKFSLKRHCYSKEKNSGFLLNFLGGRKCVKNPVFFSFFLSKYGIIFKKKNLKLENYYNQRAKVYKKIIILFIIKKLKIGVLAENNNFLVFLFYCLFSEKITFLSFFFYCFRQSLVINKEKNTVINTNLTKQTFLLI